MTGISFAAACAQEDASDAEHTAVFAEDCSLLSASVSDGVSCPRAGAAQIRIAMASPVVLKQTSLIRYPDTEIPKL
jgi:hypothetical protein